MAENNNQPSNAELIAELERLTGRQISSREDIRDYVNALSIRDNERRSKSQRLKNALLATLLEEHFGWGKTVGRIRQTVYRGLRRVDQHFKLTMTASNLVRIARIVHAAPQGTA